MEISAHDNVLVAYEVRCAQREICLHTENRERQPAARTDITFFGVEGYHLCSDNFATIIFDVAEIPIDDILSEYKAMFEEGVAFCWPGPWNKSEAAAKAHLNERGIRAFSLSSSYGMNGWILAKSMAMNSRNETNAA